MKRIMGSIVGMVLAGAVGASDMMNQHIMDEGAYWLQGTPNNHQRYTVLCGVYRQDPDQRQVAVVAVKDYDANKNEITGEPVTTRTVVNTVSDDLDYVYGALAVTRLCAEIPRILSQGTAQALQGDDEAVPEAILNLGLDDELIIDE